ncbi:hypothetical protein DL93DRAFT_2166594 [Clavulina sp. PMI_390]|nr:hypothetical protein DL93DRAFT_2166594 [Clavulina sp. PMI_390]
MGGDESAPGASSSRAVHWAANVSSGRDRPLSSQRMAAGPPPTTQTAGSLQSLELKSGYLANKGNVARDHLANERTFLSYFRTSLTLASAGAAFLRCFSLTMEHYIQYGKHAAMIHRWSSVVAGSLMILAMTMVYLGFTRYSVVQEMLQAGTFQPSRRRVYPIIFGMVDYCCMLTIDPTEDELVQVAGLTPSTTHLALCEGIQAEKLSLPSVTFPVIVIAT